MAILKNGHFGKKIKNEIKKICLIPMKISHKLCDRMYGTQSSGLDFHLWFHFLYIALEIFTIAVLFGGGNSTLFSSFALPVLAKKSAISLPV
jgi:hypothetical protein